MWPLPQHYLYFKFIGIEIVKQKHKNNGDSGWKEIWRPTYIHQCSIPSISYIDACGYGKINNVGLQISSHLESPLVFVGFTSCFALFPSLYLANFCYVGSYNNLHGTYTTVYKL